MKTEGCWEIVTAQVSYSAFGPAKKGKLLKLPRLEN